MADGQTAEGGAQQAEGGEPQGTAETDYKALYEAEKEAKEKAVAESRKWEGRSKANKAASAKAEKTAEERIADLESKLSEKERAEERIADLESKLSEKERAEERAKLAAKVAQEKGVPADLIVGDDEESMAEWADKMLAAFKKKPAPSVRKPGSFAKDDGKDRTELRDFASALLGSKR